MMRLSTFMRASVVAGCLAAVALVSGGTALAETSTTAAPSSSLCGAIALFGNTPINKTPSTASPVVGHLTKGVDSDAACSPITGGNYSACFADSNLWLKVSAPTTGYVKFACVESVIHA